MDHRSTSKERPLGAGDVLAQFQGAAKRVDSEGEEWLAFPPRLVAWAIEAFLKTHTFEDLPTFLQQTKTDPAGETAVFLIRRYQEGWAVSIVDLSRYHELLRT